MKYIALFKYRYFVILLLLAGFVLRGSAADVSRHDTLSILKPQLSWVAKAKYGFVLPTNNLVKGRSFDIPSLSWRYSEDWKVENFFAYALEFHWTLKQDDWCAKA